MLSALALTLLPAVSADTFRAFAVGDWGGASKAPFTTPVQLSTAAAMGKVGTSFKPQQIWGVGDNFYVSITYPWLLARALSHPLEKLFSPVLTTFI